MCLVQVEELRGHPGTVGRRLQALLTEKNIKYRNRCAPDPSSLTPHL
jgi:hypothetical protein